jgi:transcriptional regulator with XRE-family HTH domain
MIMTLKELRSSKGLTQAQCAKYLGMCTRNYQTYESKNANTKTANYNAVYKKVEA